MRMGRRPVRTESPAPLPARLAGTHAPAGLQVVSVRAGLWVRAAGGPTGAGDGHGDPPADDPAPRALPDPGGAITVIVGAVGEPMPAAEPLAGLLASLAVDGHGEPIVVCHGDEPTDDPQGLARRLADRAGRPVMAQHGLLLAGQDGVARVTAVDRVRGEGWHPLAERVVHPPGGPARLVRWQAPVSGLPDLGGGRYDLGGGWSLRVVPSGLVLRAADTAGSDTAGSDTAGTDTAGTAGHEADRVADVTPHDPARFDLFLGAAPQLLPAGVLALVGRLADALPAALRARLTVVLPAGASEEWARRVHWVIPAPQCILSPPPPPPPPAAGAWHEDEQEMTVGAAVVRDDPVDGVNDSGGRPDDDRGIFAWSAGEMPDDLEKRISGEASAVPATLLAVTAQGRFGLVHPRSAAS